jgi:hypothetical protein
LLPPVGSSLSQQYFHIYPQLNLLCVPLGEADFLLQEKESIHQHWEEFIAIAGVKPEPEYLRCFPEHLLESLVQKANEGVAALGCRIAAPDTKDPVFAILNQAWLEFWHDPTNYAKWERNAVKQLRELCASSS